MTNYNSSNPQVAGIDWLASHNKLLPLNPNSVGQSAVVTATTTETVDRIKLYLRTVSGQYLDLANAGYIVDIYNYNDLNHGGVKVAYAPPVADGTNSPWIRSDTGISGSFFPLVDEDVRAFTAPSTPWWLSTVNSTDSIQSFGPIPRIRFKAGTTFFLYDETVPLGSTVSLTGKRILDARVGAYFAVGNPTPLPGDFPDPSGRRVFNNQTVVHGLMFNGVQEVVIPEATTGTGFTPTKPGQVYGADFSMFGTAREWKGWLQPLLLSDINTMLSSGAGSFGLAFDNIRNSQQQWVFEINFKVVYCDEKRVATGYATEPLNSSSSPDGRWVEFLLRAPTTGATTTWNKTAGNTYLIVVRSSPLTLPGNSWRSLDTAATVGHENESLTGVSNADIGFVDPAHIGFAGLNALTDLTLTPPTTSTAAPAYYFQNVTTVRNDSQVYASAAATRFIQDGQGLEQEFSNAGAGGAYGMVSFLLRNNDNLHTADAPMVVSLIRRSDSATLATVSVTADDFDLPDVGPLPPIPGDFSTGLWYPVRVRFPSAPILASGTQYAIRFVSDATVGFYEVMLLNAKTTEAAAMSQGGTTNVVSVFNYPTVGTSTDIVAADMVVGAVVVPAQISGMNVSNANLDTGHDGTCIVDTVHYAFITWTGTGLGAQFLRYEIERNDDGNWVRVASISNPALTAFSDYESRRNIPTVWRIRQVRTDGAWSDWANSPTRTITANDFECVLTCNQNAGLTLGLMDEPGHHYERLATSRQVERTLYGRNKTLVFRETEDRGERFERRFVISWNDPNLTAFPAVSGRTVYDPLVSLIETASMPYLALLDHRGRRWYTAATIQDLDHEEPLGRYFADIEFLEVNGPTPANL